MRCACPRRQEQRTGSRKSKPRRGGVASNSAVTAEVTLSDAAYFTYDSTDTTKLTGISEAGLNKIADAQTFEVIFPADVVQVFTAAFQGNTKLVKVSFAENSQCSSFQVNRWQRNVFLNCTALKEVDFTNATKLNTVFSSLFEGCTSLDTVTFADALQDNAELTIASNAFKNTGFTSFTIPAYATSVARDAFAECKYFTTLSVAEGNAKYTYYTDADGNRYDQAVYEKGEDGTISAFSFAPFAMKKITLPYGAIKNLETWDVMDLLNSASELQTVTIEENDDVYAYGNCLFVKEGGRFDGEVLPANDLILAPYSAEEIALPAGFIHECEASSADDQSTWFWTLYLQSMQQNMSGFVHFRQLKKFTVDENNPVYTSVGGSLFKKDFSKYYVPYAATSFTVPAGMETFDPAPLKANGFIKSINAEEENPNYASYHGVLYKKDMTEIVAAPSIITDFYVPESLEKIGETVFFPSDSYSKNTIKNVYVTDLVKWSQIQFGEPIETDEQYAGNPDGSLSKERRRNVAGNLLNRRGANPLSGGADLYVRDGARWALVEQLVLDFEGKISELAFAGCNSIRSVVITNKVTRIGEMAFAMCKNIRSMSVPYIGDRQDYSYIVGKATDTRNYYLTPRAYEIFGGRGNLDLGGTYAYSLAPDMMDSFTVTGYNVMQSVVLRDGLTWDETLQQFGVPEPGSVVYGIPERAFSDAPIKKVIISIDNADGHELVLGQGLFGSSKVTAVDLRNSKVTSAGNVVFSNSQIEEVTVPDTMKVIGSGFFFDMYGGAIKKVVIPENVEYIDYQNFTALDTLTLPSTIGGFGSLNGIKTVYLTGWTDYENSEYSVPKIEIDDIPYVATNAEIYANLPAWLRTGEGNEDASNSYALHKSVFYQAETVFELRDANGNLLASKTETHLASAMNEKGSMKYVQVQSEYGDPYWAIDENYTLPDSIGYYKVDNTAWTLEGARTRANATADTCLQGTAEKYVFTQTLPADENILLTYGDITQPYNGKRWDAPKGLVFDYILATKGGNGYNSSSVMPVDVGEYLIGARCKEGYAWFDDTGSGSSSREFTLTITPVSGGKVEWFYSADGSATGQNVTETALERVYDGTSPQRLLYAEFTDIFGNKRRVDYNNLTFYNAGDYSAPVYSTTDAGAYEVALNNAGKSTDNVAWLGNYIFEGYYQFSITPRVIDLNDYNTLAWGLKGYGSLLRDGEIYIYNGTPYAYEHPELGTPDSTLSVLDSIVRVRESGNHEIEIGNIPALLAGIGAQYSATYLGNTAEGVGRYTATATLTVANGNYVFGYGLGSDLKSRGMTITVNADGTALITKVWYVVKIDNGLLNPADGSEYIISDWTYGDSVTIAAPRLEHGDENADGYLTNGLVHFELLRGNESIASGFGRDSFNHYINSSMPAGQYTLVCTVSNVHLGNHTHWWNNEEHNNGTDGDVRYHGFTRNFTFEVKTAEIGFTLPALTGGGYADYEWELSENKNTFFTAFETEANKNVILASIPRAGYWAGLSETDAAKYYGSYAFTYNLLRMNNQEYFEVSDANLLNLIEGGASGTYTVYFQITALNHTPLTAMSDERYDYYFTVTVWEKVVVPTVGDVEYTGNKVLPEVAESNLYEAIWTADDGYVAGGAHSVSFKLYDSVHYRWASDDVTTDTVSVSFEITKATNEWVRNPNIISWNYGGCDADINRIIAVPKFLDSEKNVLYSIVNEDGTAVKDGEGHEIAALVDFTADADGKVSDAVLAALQKLDAGVYNLVAKVEGTGNYHEKITSDTAFTILPANNEWVVTPNVIRWSYSNYDKNVNLILASARLKNNPVEFRIYSNEDLTDAHALTAWFTAPDGIVPEAVETILAELNQGTYYLVSKVEADGNNYMGLEPEPQSFVIAKAANNWLVTPNVIQWSYGGYNVNTNLILASARYSDDRHPITFKITTDEAGEHPVAGLESFTAIDGVVANDVAEKLAAFGTGTYYLISSVTYGDGDNYTSLAPEPQEFSVTRAVNAWTVTPGVTTWIVGNYDNEEDFDAAIGRILAEARFGKVDIVITEVDNEENVVYDSANGIDNLASAGVGIYAFSARVAGTDDYSELTYAFNFKIFPKEGLPWWATLVITVGALLVAAAIIFILWKKGVFQILTGKIVLAIRTRASVDATIASVRAAKKMEEGRKSVEAAKRRERIEELQRKAAEARAMPAEERAAMLEAKAAAQAEKAEKMRSKSESMKKRAERMRNKSGDAQGEAPEATEPEATQSVTEETPVENAQQTEVAASDDRSEE